jgi:hypothetical protein
MVTTDGKVIFGGSQNIQRCDMCIMLSRLKANVPMPDRSDVKLIPGKIDGAFSFGDTLISLPKSAEEYRSNMRYIMKNGQTQFKVNYENVKLTATQYEELVDTVLGNAYYAFNRAYEDYPQYAMFYDEIGVEWSYQRWDGYYISVFFTISITPNSEVLAGTLHSHITSMELQCREIINDMYTSGALKSSMTYREKARVLYGYVTDRFTYDLNYVGAIPTTCLRDNRAVCSGYTYIYAALCQMAGVPMFAENGYCGENNDYGGHTWNVITDNGETYYIDATWADMDIKGRPNMSFFWLTQSELQEIDPGRRVEDIVEYDS